MFWYFNILLSCKILPLPIPREAYNDYSGIKTNVLTQESHHLSLSLMSTKSIHEDEKATEIYARTDTLDT